MLSQPTRKRQNSFSQVIKRPRKKVPVLVFRSVSNPGPFVRIRIELFFLMTDLKNPDPDALKPALKLKVQVRFFLNYIMALNFHVFLGAIMVRVLPNLVKEHHLHLIKLVPCNYLWYGKYRRFTLKKIYGWIWVFKVRIQIDETIRIRNWFFASNATVAGVQNAAETSQVVYQNSVRPAFQNFTTGAQQVRATTTYNYNWTFWTVLRSRSKTVGRLRLPLFELCS